MLQDDCRDLSRWLANKPDARHVFRKNLTMKTKTSELTGAALDWAAAKAEGLKVASNTPAGTYTQERGWFEPTTDWAQGGLIIEREGIALLPPDGHRLGTWCAYYWAPSQHDITADDAMQNKQRGPTPLIAAMRCFVASHLGEEVEIPNELA